jgi:HPt (histidine-containing phosphotransfer) domain-containing protein
MAKPDVGEQRTFEIDVTVLGEVLQVVGPAEVGSFVQSIAADMGRLIDHLDEVGSTDLLGAVGREAHHLGGGCRAVGLVGIGAVCARIEADARAGQRDAFPAYSVQLAQQRNALGNWWSTAAADPRLSAFWPLA